MLTTDANLGNLGGFVAFPNQWALREAAEDPVFFTAPLSIGSDNPIALLLQGQSSRPFPHEISHPIPSPQKRADSFPPTISSSFQHLTRFW